MNTSGGDDAMSSADIARLLEVTPARVSQLRKQFATATDDVPAFLDANGITRATNLKNPIKYRIPNPLVRREQVALERAAKAEHELATSREQIGRAHV